MWKCAKIISVWVVVAVAVGCGPSAVTPSVSLAEQEPEQLSEMQMWVVKNWLKKKSYRWKHSADGTLLEPPRLIEVNMLHWAMALMHDRLAGE